MSPTATGAPSARSAARRRAILDAALAVFTERGYHQASIEEIRDRSYASVGSIYHHFGGKEELAAALYLEGLRDYHERFLAVLRARRDVETTVRGIVAGHLRWMADHPQ